eukprot:m.30099 g.30099  ORF g.30099 m.30099 type:complete len:516 (-) comp13831_c0_seq2:137-1684(-)
MVLSAGPCNVSCWMATVVLISAVAATRSCGRLTIANNTGIVVKEGVNINRFNNYNGTLEGCCSACAAVGGAVCEAFFTGPDYKLCILYPSGSIVGTRTVSNHTAAFRGPLPPPIAPPSPKFPGGSLDQRLVVLTPAEADAYGAKCLDGSPPALYYSPARGTANQDNWVLYFKGGGWCYDEASCAQRARGSLGTTTVLPPFINQTWDESSGPAHPNATLNPTFSNFHRVVLWYCDGASFAGAREQPVVTSNGTLYFRGRAVLDALLGKLKKDYGLDRAKQVLLTGCSAGGMSTYLHADYVHAQLASPALLKYKVAALSGFFLDHDTTTGIPLQREEYDYMFQMQNMTAGVNQACVKATTAAGHLNCSTPQQNYAYITSPFFVLNSMLDAYQMSEILHVGCALDQCNNTQIRYMQQYQQDFYNTISRRFTQTFTKTGNGAFLYNCGLHCGEQDATGFNHITVQDTVMQAALSRWWSSDNDPAKQHTYIESCTLQGPAACNPTCPARTLCRANDNEWH